MGKSLADQIHEKVIERIDQFNRHGLELKQLVDKCKHPYCVKLWGTYNGSYSYDSDDFHSALYRCLVCGKTWSSYDMLPEGVKIQRRLDIYHYINGTVPSYHRGRPEEKKYAEMKRLFGWEMLSKSTFKERRAVAEKEGYPV